MDNEQLQALLRKQKNGTLTEVEQAILDTWYLKLSQTETTMVDTPDMERRLDAVWNNLQPRDRAKIVRMNIRRIAAAAILLIIAGAMFFKLRHHPEPVQALANHDFLPGTNKATLTLANGQKIVLSKNNKGQIAVQGQTSIQMQNGTVTYAGDNDQIVATNTLTTQRKEEFPLVLADGTEVMLDATSSITYPVAFNGKERRVKITGQAYFKVVHNDKQPFVVEVKGQTIRDIGTEFNINAYDDEPVVKTTLVEGSISVDYNQNLKTLKPGQEADLANNSLVVKAGDIEGATAWKHDNFHFTGNDVKTIMRQFSRWYDVDVTYEGEIPDHEFGGDISRNVPASKVFKHLAHYGLQFKVEGKNIIISKK
ncbi:FecR family protein [Mucilaginibacter ximonensis]|uniref:FecR family protein n=1 Tax=Mucilaginibacter ximonensis TaxID=538021 RepID=A0ABW5Y995_9SPHI